jgi:hypothetical protein
MAMLHGLRAATMAHRHALPQQRAYWYGTCIHLM